MKKKIVIAITGASGSLYAARLINYLESHPAKPEIAVIFSEISKSVWKTEIGKKPEISQIVFEENDFMAPFASGSSVWDSMVIVPCTMGSLGKIAAGIADNLITRAADVFLKEKRQLIIVPRETPVNIIHVENMKKLINAGALILPASPSLYSKPESVEEVVDTVVFRIMDNLGISSENAFRW